MTIFGSIANNKPNQSFICGLYKFVLLFALILVSTSCVRAAETSFEATPGWHLISLPYSQTTAASPCETLGLTSVFGLTAGIYRNCGSYTSWPAGQGFWAYFEEKAQLPVLGDRVSGDAPYAIALQPGWNIVGTPFLFPVDIAGGVTVDGVPIADSSDVVPVLYEYESGTDGYVSATQLEPWHGYFIYAKSSVQLLVLPIDAGSTENSGTTASLKIVDSAGNEITAIDLDAGAETTVKAAAYDADGQFTGYVPVNWSAAGGASVSTSGPSESATITAGSAGAEGQVTASAKSLSAGTRVVVLGAGKLFEYPFDEETKLVQIPGTDLKAVSGQAIVIFAPGTTFSRAKEIIEATNGTLIGFNAAAAICQIKMPAGAQFDDYKAGLLAVQDVADVSKNLVFETGSYPNDPIFDAAAPWKQRWGYEKIRMPQVWSTLQPVGAPLIAIVDTGLDTSHPDLAGAVEPGRNFVDPSAPDDVSDASGHGTAVAGVIAARPNNGIGIAGVCRNCKVMPLKACTGAGACPLFNVANAITYAADRGANVINLSLGAHLDADSPSALLLEQIVRYAASKNAAVVAAAGNENSDAGDYYPAACSNAISVAATDENDKRAAFSNYGPTVDLAAPGTGIYTTVPGSYDYVDGTSIAAGYVTGLAGMLLSVRSGLSPKNIEILLQSTAQSTESDQPVGGRIDAGALMAYFGGFNSAPNALSITQDYRVVAPGSKVKLEAYATDPDGDTVEYKWSAADGSLSAAAGQSIEWTLPALKGDYRITATVSDSYGNSKTADAWALVLDSKLVSVEVSPVNKIVDAGQTVEYKALCFGQYAHSSGEAGVPCNADWTVTGSVGKIGDDGIFSALNAGSGYVAAQVDGVFGSTKIAVRDASGEVLYTATLDNGVCTTTWFRSRCNVAGTNETTLTLPTRLTARNEKNPNKWPRNFAGCAIYSQAVSKGGKIIFGDGCNYLRCLYQSDGSDCLTAYKPSVAGGIYATPSFSSDMNHVIVTDLNGYVYKIDISVDPPVKEWEWTPSATGTYVFFTPPAVMPDPLDGHDVIFITNTTDNGLPGWGHIYALRDNDTHTTPTRIWQYPALATVRVRGLSGPVFAKSINGKSVDMVFTSNSQDLYAFTATGSLKYTFSCGGDCGRSPTLGEYGGNTYVYTGVNNSGTYSGWLKKYDPDPVTGGAMVWSANIGIDIEAAAANRNNIFYLSGKSSLTSSSIVAVQDNGAGTSTPWPPVTPTITGTVNGAPTLFQNGLIYTSLNGGGFSMVDTSSGSIISESSIIGNTQDSPIIMFNAGTSENEAYVGNLSGTFYALERNWPPVITAQSIVPATLLWNAPLGAALDITATDANGPNTDLDYAVVNLTNIGGGAAVALTQDMPIMTHFYITAAGSTIKPAKGISSGAKTLTVTVYDKGGLSAATDVIFIVGNAQPINITASFSPSFIYADNLDSTTLTVTVTDYNNELLDGVEADLSLIGGATSTPLTCVAFNPVTWQTTCTALNITADPLVATTGLKTLPVTVKDGAFTVFPAVQPTLSVVALDHYTLTATTPIQAGASSTVTMKAYSTLGQITTYNNTAPITLTLPAPGATGLIAFSGTGVTDNGDGTASIAASSFAGGLATFYISDTKVESGIKVKATDTLTSKNGTSNPIAWTSGVADHLQVDWTNTPITIGNNADIQITVLDEYGNTCTDFQNLNGFTLIYNPATPPDPTATLVYSGTPAAAVTDNGDGTADFNAGIAYFSSGVATFQVSDTYPDTGVIFTVTDNVTASLTGDSGPVTWNSGTLDKFVLTVTPGNPAAGATATVTITAYDNFNNVMLGYGNSADITLSLDSGTAATTRWGDAADGVTDNGDGTATLASGHFTSGVATVRIRNTNVETQTISVTEYDPPTPPDVTATANITWGSGALSYFTVQESGPSAVVGSNIDITITAKDAFGNTITDFHNLNGVMISQINGTPGGFSWNGAPGATLTLTGDIFTNGVYSNIHVADSAMDSNVHIVATETSTSLTGQSGPLAWTAGPLDHFHISANPAPHPAGDAAIVTITAYDSLGNVKIDWNLDVNLSEANGTAAKLSWSGAAITITGAGRASLSGTQFVSGVASASLTDTAAEGPIFINVDDGGSVTSQSAAIESPSWVVGPLAKIIIRDAVNNGGIEVLTHSMAAGAIFTVYAAGYDAYDNYTQDETVTWSTTGSLDSIGATSAASLSFQPVTELTSGTIHADAGGGITDDTGTIDVTSATPKAPVLTAQALTGQISLSWPGVDEYLDGNYLDPGTLVYKIWRRTATSDYNALPDFPPTGLGDTNYTDATVTPWDTYYYKIKAVISVVGTESAFSNEASAIAVRPPMAEGGSCPYADPNQYYLPSAQGHLNRPGDIAVGGTSPAGVNYVFVADTNNNRISLFDENCNFYGIYGKFGAAPGQFNMPTGILYNAGLLYIIDYYSRLQVINTNNSADTSTWSATSFAVANPWKLAFGPGGNILIATSDNKIVTMDPSSGSFTSFPAPYSRGVAYNPSNGLIYVSDNSAGIIRVFNTSGAEQPSIGFGKGSTYGYLNAPQDLDIDTNGNIYVADRLNNRVQVFSSSGALLNVIGTYNVTNNKLYYPVGIALSTSPGGDNLLWVADTMHQRFVSFTIPPGGP
jgi:thermitase